MRPGNSIVRLLLAVLIAMLFGSARAQTSGARAAATQPPTDAAAEGAADTDDIWREPDEPSVLTTAAEVRALTPEQAAAARHVRIHGTVTYITAAPPVMFVQDATGGVCVAAPRERDLKPPLLRNGATVVVEGVTARGGDVAYITSADANPVRIRVFPNNWAPAPRLATVPQLNTSALHGELVEVVGLVRSVRIERLAATGPDTTVLTLSQGGIRVDAMVRGGEAIVPAEFVGAVVRARGVFNAATLPRMEIATRRLLLRTARDLRIRTAATAGDALPITPIHLLQNLASGEAATGTAAPGPAPRTRVQGVVTLALPGRGAFVQDPTGGVWVSAAEAGDAAIDDSTATPLVRAGDQVDVVGFPGRRGWSTVLADAAWTKTGDAPMPDAPQVTADQALDPQIDARLVRIDALVLSVSRISQHSTLALQSGGRVFLARLADSAARPPQAVVVGSWVRLSGVCVQTPLEESWNSGASVTAVTGPQESPPTDRPSSFYLLLPSDKAIQVISAPGWWTLGRVLIVCGVLAAVALASITWVVALRRRVARQTGMIHEHLAKRALYEERVRIARDLHDSLEQDLLGITMQLNATEKLLTQPERARQSLQLAAAMVRRSQAETHRAVWDLREQRTGQDGLVSAIREAVAGMRAPRGASDVADHAHSNGNGSEGPRVEVRTVGHATALPPQVENHLLRVALEGVTNAVKHSGATLIEVEIVFEPEQVGLTVRDDGSGFDPERAPSPRMGHFGLFGMHERAEKLGGKLTICSRPGGGSEIHLVVPTAGNNGSHSPDHAAEAVAS